MNKIERLAQSLCAELFKDGRQFDLTRDQHTQELCLRLVHAASQISLLDAKQVKANRYGKDLKFGERLMLDHLRFAASSYAKSLGLPISFGPTQVGIVLPNGDDWMLS